MLYEVITDKYHPGFCQKILPQSGVCHLTASKAVMDFSQGKFRRLEMIQTRRQCFYILYGNRITSYNVCYTKLLRDKGHMKTDVHNQYILFRHEIEKNLPTMHIIHFD